MRRLIGCLLLLGIASPAPAQMGSFFPGPGTVHSAGGGGTIFAANPALGGNDPNPNSSFRVRSVLAANSNGTVRVTLSPGTTGTLQITHASLCKWDGVNAPSDDSYNCTTAPLELKFAGASGFSGASTDQASDALVHSGSFSLSTGETAIVIYDTPNVSTSLTSQKFTSSSTNARTGYITPGAQTWNLQTVPNINLDLTATNYCVATITSP